VPQRVVQEQGVVLLTSSMSPDIQPTEAGVAIITFPISGDIDETWCSLFQQAPVVDDLREVVREYSAGGIDDSGAILVSVTLPLSSALCFRLVEWVKEAVVTTNGSCRNLNGNIGAARSALEAAWNQYS
jgi:hypothetical protein